MKAKKSPVRRKKKAGEKDPLNEVGRMGLATLEGKPFPGISDALWEQISCVRPEYDDLFRIFEGAELSPVEKKFSRRLQSIERQFLALFSESEARGNEFMLAELAEQVVTMINWIHESSTESLDWAMYACGDFPFALPAESSGASAWRSARERFRNAKKRMQKEYGPPSPAFPHLKGAVSELTLDIVGCFHGKNRFGAYFKSLPPWELLPDIIPLYEKAAFKLLAENPDFLERHFHLLPPEMRKETYTKGQKVDWLKKAVREDFRTMKRAAARAAKGLSFLGKKPVK